MCTYHEVTDDHSEQEEGHADGAPNHHTVPHGLYPFTTQHSKHYHERVEEILKVPARQTFLYESVLVLLIVLSEQLHSHHSEYKHNDC